MERPSLSVVMPAHNAARHICEALESLFRQTRDDFEILVVDDGSSDGTADRARAAVAAHRSAAPEVRVIRQAHCGPSVARNRAIAEANAPLIGFLDADDRWAPGKAERHLQVMEATPDLDLTFSGFRFVGEAGEELYESYRPSPGTLSYVKLLERNIIHTSTVVASRRAIERAGGFDPLLRTFEDFDLWLRIAALKPGNVLAIPEQLVDYRRHGAQVTSNWRRMHEGWKAVIDRHRRDHPDAWAEVERVAWGNHLEYCAALSYNAGNLDDMRDLIRRSWRVGGIRMARRYNALLMTMICVTTYLPRPLQLVLGRSFKTSRRLRHQMAERVARGGDG